MKQFVKKLLNNTFAAYYNLCAKFLLKLNNVVIEDNVFIGAHTTILKGVKIGKNSIIGSCSLVSKEIPPNEVWGGNPAKFIKKINSSDII